MDTELAVQVADLDSGLALMRRLDPFHALLDLDADDRFEVIVPRVQSRVALRTLLHLTNEWLKGEAVDEATLRLGSKTYRLRPTVSAGVAR